MSIQKFADSYVFPIIIKPRSEAASVGVAKLNNLESVFDYLENSQNSLSELMVEEFISHKLLHIDGVYNGDRTQYSVSRCTNCLHNSESPAHISISVPSNNPLHSAVIKLVSRTVESLGVESGMIVHAEVFQDRGTGKLMVNEIACRLGGGRIRPAVLQNIGVDLVKDSFLLTIGKEIDANPIEVSSGFALIRTRKTGYVKSLPEITDDESITDFSIHCRIGELLSKSEKSVSCFASIVVSSDDRTKVFKVLFDSIKTCKRSIQIESKI